MYFKAVVSSGDCVQSWGGGLGGVGGEVEDDFSHAQSTMKCPFNHTQKLPWIICAAAEIYISKQPPY